MYEQIIITWKMFIHEEKRQKQSKATWRQEGLWEKIQSVRVGLGDGAATHGANICPFTCFLCPLCRTCVVSIRKKISLFCCESSPSFL